MKLPRLKPYQIALEAVCFLLLLAGLVFVVIKYPGRPAKIPNHFDGAGNVTDYSGKGSLWLLEGVSIGMYAMMTVFIFIPAVVRNPNVTWQVNPASRGALASETISLLGECKLECIALFDYMLIPIVRGVSMGIWPVWLILGIMTAGIILRLIRMKKVSAMPKQPWG